MMIGLQGRMIPTDPFITPCSAGFRLVSPPWLRYFCLELSLAAIIVLHRPSLAGGFNQPHAHIFVPARKLTVNGFGAGARPFCTNTGNQLCFESWSAFCEAWRARTGGSI